MMHYDRGLIVFECDDCDEILETGTDTFSEAIEKSRAEGWSAKRYEGGWEHLCRGCSHD